MPGGISLGRRAAGHHRRSSSRDPSWVRWTVSVLAIAVVAVLIVVPVVLVVQGAFENGYRAYLDAVSTPEARSAISLTLLTASLVVPANTAFGVAAAYSLTRFDFPGKRVLLTLIDLPLTVSPVISGMVFVLLFGAQGLLGSFLSSHGIKIVFAVPGIALATSFVTFPFVARELIALMETQSADEEEAAVMLGASGWAMFFRVTLPRIKWALLYGVILCSARAVGEFGAVSVVSGHIRGATNTIPLHVEILYNEYAFAAAFAVSSLLVLLAVLTLIGKSALEYLSLRDRSTFDHGV